MSERRFCRGAPGRSAPALAEIDRDLAADDRLDAAFDHLLGEFERAEKIAGVGEAKRRHAVGPGESRRAS